MSQIRSFLFPISLLLMLLLVLSGMVNVVASLFLGAVYALSFGNPRPKLTQQASEYLLKFCIILMGFGLNFNQLVETTQSSFWLIVISLALAFSIGWLLGHWFNLDSKLALLIAGGTAICGASAIAALAPVLRAKPSQIIIAIGVVFILNAAALLLFPYLGELFLLNQTDFGLWTAVAIHDTSSVVGAAARYGDEALAVATSAKLARALWIVPLVLLISLMHNKRAESLKIPYFILGFVIASVLTSFASIPLEVTESITSIAKKGFALSLLLIGMSFTRSMFKELEANAFWQGLSLWICVSSISLFLIKYQWL